MTLSRLLIIACAMCLATTTINAQQNKKTPASKTVVKKTTTPAKKPAATVCNAKAIDLGLPSGTLWADRNVGAEKPDDYGGLYRYGNRGKGNGEGTPKDENIIGTQYDVAKTKMGGKWRTPSFAQFEELYTYCAFDYVTYNKNPGYLVTGPNGNEIFLPLTGCMYNYGRSQAGQFACYATGERGGYEMYVYGEIYCLALWVPKDGNDIKLTYEGAGMGNPIRAVQAPAE